MLAKKIALGFGIAIILPIMVYYGINTFSPGPSYETFSMPGYYQKYPKASEEQKAKLNKVRAEFAKEYQTRREAHDRIVFYVTVPIGIAAILFGAFTSVQAIGTGMMFGGIICVVDGYCSFWYALPDNLKFISLLIAFCLLIFIGYKKMPK